MQRRWSKNNKFCHNPEIVRLDLPAGQLIQYSGASQERLLLEKVCKMGQLGITKHRVGKLKGL